MIERSPLVARYLNEVSRHPLLTREQELRLVRDVRAGCSSARNRLVEANLGFVIRVAKEYRNRGLAFEDLLNEGNLGLIEATQRYDASRGTRFITFAVWWIRKAILLALDRQSSLIRVPGYQRRKHAGRPSRCYIPTVSIDAPVERERETTLSDRLPQTRACPEKALLREEAHEMVEDAVRCLPERERRVVVGRFGLDGEPPRRLRELAEEIGLSRERVRQIESLALDRLRRILRARRSARRVRRMRAPLRLVVSEEASLAH